MIFNVYHLLNCCIYVDSEAFLRYVKLNIFNAKYKYIPILVIALRITSTPPEPPRAPCSCGRASRRQSSQPGGQAAGAQAANK